VVLEHTVHHKRDKAGYDGEWYKATRDASGEETNKLWKIIGHSPNIVWSVVMPWRNHTNGDYPWMQRVTVFEGKPDIKKFSTMRANKLSDFINSLPDLAFKVQFYASLEGEDASPALNEYLEDDDVAMLLKIVFGDTSKDTLSECDELMKQAYGDAELGKMKLESMDDEVRRTR